MPISSVNPMFDHMLESSHRYDCNKWSNIGFTEEIMCVMSINVFSPIKSGSMGSLADSKFSPRTFSKDIIEIFASDTFQN